MDFLVVLSSLLLLMFVAYRGYSVILFAPICAMLAVVCTDPAMVPTRLIATTRSRCGLFSCGELPRPQVYNSAALVDSYGTLYVTYDKNHRVMFGEYRKPAGPRSNGSLPAPNNSRFAGPENLVQSR